MTEIVKAEAEKINNMGALELDEYEGKLKYTAPKLKMQLIELCEARRKKVAVDIAMVEPSEVKSGEFFQ